MDPAQDQDVDMDAPQISTLHQEDSPPPQPPRRVKLLVKDTRPGAGQASSSRKRPLPDDDEPEEEDEEDQLIDDDDVVPLARPVVTVPAPAESSSKRKAPSKRKPRKNEKKAVDEDRKSKEKIVQPPAPNLGATMSWFEVSAAKAHQQAGQMGTIDMGQVPLNVVNLDAAAASGSLKQGPAKKKGTRKTPAVPRPRGKPGPKPKVPPPAAAPVMLPPPSDDVEVASEAGYSFTAASSPAHVDGNTPEPEPVPYTNGTAGEETVSINLQDIPLPQYPLPLKPFPVQAPHRINTGFAPIVPLDRTGAKVRHWRKVNREIRGIAGGRWFTHSWMGEKESPLALAIASGAGDKQSSSVALPKLATVSISSASGVPPKTKARATKNSSLTGSTAPSRSSSAVPSKMRTIMVAPPTAPPSEAESDVVAVSGL
ncbi:hypothetical protein R3P38DRAFT_16423 [Favolaschia claudopus]|uniref:Uncharacterized protein n=1 Tax=Favolaschia claudopus TaxID=2862362 RepID=A0AAW0EH25_9AGAR